MGPLGLLYLKKIKGPQRENEKKWNKRMKDEEEGRIWKWKETGKCLEDIHDDVIWRGHGGFQHTIPQRSVRWSLTNICILFITGPEKLNTVCIYLDSSMQSWGWIQALEEENCLSKSQREKAALSIRCIWMRLKQRGIHGCFMRWGIFLK